MMHLKEGALRRLYDEPFSLTGSMREHFDSCPRCQERLQVMAGEAREVLGRMVVEGSTVDAVAALNVVRRRLTPPVRRRFALPSLGWKAPVLAAALVAALVSVVAFTPPLAARLTSIFSPQHVTPVAIQSGSLTGLDALSTYGAVNWSGRPQLETADTAQAAAQKSGLPLINPGYLPSAVVGKPVGYGATTRADVNFTFSQAKARQAAQAAGRSVPNFPAGADGSVMKVTIGPAEAAIYGDLRQVLKAAGSSTSTSSAEQSILSAGPFLAVAESRAPVVSSSGMSVAQLKQLLLSQPGLSPQLRSIIKSLNNPIGNLPIPIPADMASAQQVKVQGVDATALGDNTGLGSAVIWIKGGIVYAVAGTVSETDALAVANSLR